jgi:predicted phosphodiesterase
MRVLIISDIHANLTALEAVIADAGEIDAVWFLGDLVGYGPDPNECIERVQTLPGLVALTGNHDAATLEKLSTESFNHDARRAVHWTQDEISLENLSYLEELNGKIQVTDDVILAHGSPRQPIWEYILNTRAAAENFYFFDSPYCFVGHTHLPSIFCFRNSDSDADLIVPTENVSFSLSPRMILNPGSVGQPRDRDPRAAYALLDVDKSEIEFRRVEYDIQAVQERMREADLPDRHIDRLELGW